MRQTKDSFFQGKILAVVWIVSWLIEFVYRIPLGRLIGDEGIGIYFVVVQLNRFGMVLSCIGIPIAISRLVAMRLRRKEHHNALHNVMIALLCCLFFGGMISAVLFFCADMIAFRLFHNQRYALAMKVLAPNALILPVMGVMRGYFQGKQTMIPTGISMIFEQLVHASVGLIAAYYVMMAHSTSFDIASYGAAGASFGVVVGSSVGLLLLLIIFTLYRSVLKHQLKRDQDGYRETLMDGATSVLSALVPVVISQMIVSVVGIVDVVLFHQAMSAKGMPIEQRDQLLGLFMNKYELMTSLPIVIAGALSIAMLPVLTPWIAVKQTSRMRQWIRTVMQWNMLLVLPFTVGLAVLAKPILLLMFGSQIYGRLEVAVSMLQIGSFAVIFVTLSMISYAILQACNQLRATMCHSFVALGIHIVFVAVMLRYTNAGLYALIAGSALSGITVCVLNFRCIHKTIGYVQETTYTFVLPFMSSVLMGAVAYGSNMMIYRMTQSNTISVLCAILISVLCYVRLLSFMRVIQERDVRA